MLERDAEHRAVMSAKDIVSHRRSKSPRVESYLEVGRFLSDLAQRHPSTKVRGAIIRERYPDIHRIPADLRSNCKWLYEKLRDNPSELLQVLRLDDIDDFFTSHPTVIRRAYRRARPA